MGNIHTKEEFGDFQLHLEFATGSGAGEQPVAVTAEFFPHGMKWC